MINVADIFKQDLRGHAYIAARGLNPEMVKNAEHICPECRKAEMLPAVQRLLEARRLTDR